MRIESSPFRCTSPDLIAPPRPRLGCRRCIGCAIEVHRTLGPGLLESTYEQCLGHELDQAGIPHVRQVPLPLTYKGSHLNHRYRLDLVIAETLILEIKAIDQIHPIHEAQLLTYLSLSRLPIGLILNFNSVALKDGIRRLIL